MSETHQRYLHFLVLHTKQDYRHANAIEVCANIRKEGHCVMSKLAPAIQSSKYLTQKCWHLGANSHKHSNTARVRGGNRGSTHKTQPWLSHKPYGRDSKISAQEASSKFSALFCMLWDLCRTQKACSRDQGHQQWTLYLQWVIETWGFVGLIRKLTLFQAVLYLLVTETKPRVVKVG